MVGRSSSGKGNLNSIPHVQTNAQTPPDQDIEEPSDGGKGKTRQQEWGLGLPVGQQA
jgi:hypothetical protein